jgi:flagellar protein FlaG
VFIEESYMNDVAVKVNRSAMDGRSAVDARGQQKVTGPSKENPPAQEPVQAVTRERVSAVVEQIDTYLKGSRRELQFQVDEESGQVVVRVRDAATGDVIRQIPGEEALRMARALQEKTPVLLDLIV